MRLPPNATHNVPAKMDGLKPLEKLKVASFEDRADAYRELLGWLRGYNVIASRGTGITPEVAPRTVWS